MDERLGTGRHGYGSISGGAIKAARRLAEAAQRLTQALPSSLIAGALLALSIPVVLAMRWWVLARPVVSWPDALGFTWIGSFYSLILPGAVSGDVAKGSLLALKSTGARQAALPASILTDRLVGFAVMLSFFCLSSLLVLRTAASPELARFALPAAGAGAAAVGALLLGWTKACRGLRPAPNSQSLQRPPSPTPGSPDAFGRRRR